MLLGFIQGCILSGLLFTTTGKHAMNRFLGMVVLMISLACLNIYFYHADWLQSSNLYQLVHAIIPLVIIMPLGPLIYFYTKSLVSPTWRLSKKDRWHFCPVILDIVPNLTALVYIIGTSIHLISPHHQPWGMFIDTYNTYVDLPRWLSLTLYLCAAYRLIKRNKLNSILENWLLLFMRAFGMFQWIWLCFLIPYLIPRYSHSLVDAVGWYPIFVPLVVLIYWMGIKGYLLSKTEIGAKWKLSKSRTTTPPEDVANVITLLTQAMESDQLFLDPDLNLSQVAKHTGVKAKVISFVLNNHLDLSFNRWVNGYRVTAFKQKVMAGTSSHLTLAGIAFECGFSSQASFQRIFKQLTGSVPSQYRYDHESKTAAVINR